MSRELFLLKIFPAGALAGHKEARGGLDPGKAHTRKGLDRIEGKTPPLKQRSPQERLSCGFEGGLLRGDHDPNRK